MWHYRKLEGAVTQKTKICFVCLGNIVRSPLAENLFRDLAEKSQVGHKYEVDSAGTSSWHVGEAPDSRMKRVAARHGLKLRGRSRQFRRQDFDRFDLIVAMDQDNRSNLRRWAQTNEAEAKIHLLREFDPEGGEEMSVPDPYYGGAEGFERTYDIVERSCRGLLSALESQTD
jgi:protein-tyrosine phosphatase